MSTQSVKTSGDNGSAAPAMEGEVFWPSQDVVRQANVPDWDAVAKRASKDLAGFWEEQARELDWYGPWTTVLDETQKPFYKWFTGAQVNIIHNCLDRYQNTATRNKTALIWEGENGDVRELSYATLHRDVSRFANVLKSRGLKAGDDLIEIGARGREVLAAKRVVGAELHDRDLGRETEGPVHAAKAAGSRLAGDAGIDHAVGIPFGLELRRQQRRIRPVRRHAEPGGEAVTEGHDHPLLRPGRRHQEHHEGEGRDHAAHIGSVV